MNNLEVIETINKTEENALQLQRLPVLTALLAAKGTLNNIVTSDVVYETAHGILRRGMNEVSAKVLGLLSASMHAAARDCVVRARELIRRSGCLQDMLDMFLGTITMTQEHLRVLCECLVESCLHCEENQNYCARLIPTCIQRCDSANIAILKLLHSLLLNNTRNINMFVESNGISIFTKDSIHDSSSMELLTVVVQNSSAANLLKRDSDLLSSLITVGEEYKVNCEGSWKIVEWASVILFHLASHVEGIDNSNLGRTINISNFDYEMDYSETTINDLSASFLFKPNWDKVERKAFRNGQTLKNIIEHTTNAENCFRFKPFSNDMSFRSNLINFAPNFVSTPKGRITKTSEKQATELNKELDRNTAPKINDSHRPETNTPSLVKKTLSTSARLFNIVNSSCISICHAMGYIFGRNTAGAEARGLLKQRSKNNEDRKNVFTEYVKKRVLGTDAKLDDNCYVQKQSKQKLTIRQKDRKGIVKKLKTGMHFYGCNFKKIAQGMWSHEKQMTPKVLHIIYRKCIVK